MEKYITQNKIRQANLAAIFRLVQLNPGITRRKVQEITGFSWGTVSENISRLYELGYITEEKIAEQGYVGRSTAALFPADNRKYGIELDIDRIGMSAEIISLDFNIRHRIFMEFEANNSDELLDSVKALTDKALKWVNERGELFGFGIAFQGEIDSEKGVSVKFPGIDEGFPIDIAGFFLKNYGIEVFFGHDPDCMLLSLMFVNHENDCVLVRADDGIGMAVCQKGKLLESSGKFELGHITVETPLGRQRLDGIATSSGIANAAGATVEEIFENSQNYADKINAAAKVFVDALRNMSIIFSPDRLILTGKLFNINEFRQTVDKGLSEDGIDFVINTGISAAYGAALKAISEKINSFGV